MTAFAVLSVVVAVALLRHGRIHRKRTVEREAALAEVELSTARRIAS